MLPEAQNHSHPHAHKSVTVLAIALLIFALFQLVEVLQDRVTLSSAEGQLSKNLDQADKTLEQGQKMMDQLNALALGTQKLADAGNPNAKDIIDKLAKAGVKINPNFKKNPNGQAIAPPPAPATPPTP